MLWTVYGELRPPPGAVAGAVQADDDAVAEQLDGRGAGGHHHLLDPRRPLGRHGGGAQQERQ